MSGVYSFQQSLAATSLYDARESTDTGQTHVQPARPQVIDLKELRRKPHLAGRYIMSQLEHIYCSHNYPHISCACSIYAFAEGFFLIIAHTQFARSFLSLNLVDGTDSFRIHREEIDHFPLSLKAYDSLTSISSLVRIADYDGSSYHRYFPCGPKTWPPFVFISGTWNNALEPTSLKPDIDSLLVSRVSTVYRAFSLSVAYPSWIIRKTTPTLQGVSYEHDSSSFRLWLHLPNQKSLSSAISQTKEEISSQEAIRDVLLRLEDAAAEYYQNGPIPHNESGDIDMRTLELWEKLANEASSLFPLAKIELGKKAKLFFNNQNDVSKQSLKQHLEFFFKTFPSKEHFSLGHKTINEYKKAKDSYKKNEHLTKNGYYYKEKVLCRWKLVIRRVAFLLDDRTQLDLVRLIDAYTATKSIVRSASPKEFNTEELNAQKYLRDLFFELIDTKLSSFFDIDLANQEGHTDFLRHLDEDLKAMKVSLARTHTRSSDSSTAQLSFFRRATKMDLWLCKRTLLQKYINAYSRLMGPSDPLPRKDMSMLHPFFDDKLAPLYKAMEEYIQKKRGCFASSPFRAPKLRPLTTDNDLRSAFKSLCIAFDTLLGVNSDVEQAKRQEFIESGMLSEEVAIMERIVDVLENLWRSEKRIPRFENFREIHELRRELAIANTALVSFAKFYIHKRIGSEGQVRLEILEKIEDSLLARQNAFHNAITQ